MAKLEPNGPTEKLIAELGISDIVHTSSGLSDEELAGLFASAEIACIPPSLYEVSRCPRWKPWPAVHQSWPAVPVRCPKFWDRTANAPTW